MNISDGNKIRLADEIDKVVLEHDRFMSKECKRLHEALERAAKENQQLREQLTNKEAEIDYIAKRILIALAGTVCTPAEGYIKARLGWIAHDVEELAFRYRELEKIAQKKAS